MSVDRATNGHGGNDGASGVTRFEAFDENKLQTMQTEAARLVSNGVIALEDCELDARTDDGVTLADGENEAFQQDVLDELDELSAQDATRDERAEQGEGWGPREVDFKTIWHEYDFPRKVSNTQLTGALAYSKHTSFGKGGAKTCIDHAVETGDLVDIKAYHPDCNGGGVITGAQFARGDDSE